ncbi:hypothetical protein GCM10028811_02900 [Uliginosibacterium sediminicola]
MLAHETFLQYQAGFAGFVGRRIKAFDFQLGAIRDHDRGTVDKAHTYPSISACVDLVTCIQFLSQAKGWAAGAKMGFASHSDNLGNAGRLYCGTGNG